jgi:glycosyltransferase involved in cell wall biosynthesis
MKIAVLSSFPPRKCGIAHLTKNLFDEWRAQGHQLVTFGIDVSECDYKINTNSFSGLLEVASIIKREKIEHVSVQFIIGFYGKKYFGLNFLLFLWALRKKRVIVTLHELHHIRSFGQIFRKPLDLFHITLEVLISCFSTGVILHTEAQVSDLKRYGIRDVRCVYLGIQTKSIPRTRTALSQALFFGKLVPFKGAHLFSGIARVCPEVHFVLACSVEPQYEAYRLQLVRDFEGIPNIEFVCRDWIGNEEKEACFTAADVLVLPYIDTYYQSGVASESGVYNIPVIVPKLGPLSEITLKYHVGEAVEQVDAASIKTAIHKIFGNYPHYLEGIQKYRAEANWSVAARNYLEYLRG